VFLGGLCEGVLLGSAVSRDQFVEKPLVFVEDVVAQPALDFLLAIVESF